MKTNAPKSRKGTVLPAVVAITLIFTILGFSVLNLAENEIMMTRKEITKKKTFYAAEAGLEYGVARLRKMLTDESQLTTLDDELIEHFEIPFPQIEGFTFEVFTIQGADDAQMKTIDSGPYSGMNAIVRPYNISVKATSNTPDAASVTLTQVIEDQRFHLFQFAAFYEADLELEPGPTMTIEGRMHSNHDIYLTAGNTLSIDSYLTTASNIYNNSKPGDTSEENGTVRIKDGDDYYEDLDFDSADPDWQTMSMETWDGRVQTQAHGITTLNLPIPDGVDPIQIIKRGQTDDPQTLIDERFYWKAGLRIINGVAYNGDGFPVDLTYGAGQNPLDTTKSFYNKREDKTIKVTEINIAKLSDSGHMPANGILYLSTHNAGFGQQNAIRIINGSMLPPDGLTIATDNPLYIQGNYNVNSAPAAVLCDAINFLSNSWYDGAGTMPTASETQVNTCVVAGHTPTTQWGYGGGLENLSRFLENWSGKKFIWQGSINSLWFSDIATGAWHYGYPYYTAPKRLWGFVGTTNPPPGTPMICRAFRAKWSQL